MGERDSSDTSGLGDGDRFGTPWFREQELWELRGFAAASFALEEEDVMIAQLTADTRAQLVPYVLPFSCNGSAGFAVDMGHVVELQAH